MAGHAWDRVPIDAQSLDAPLSQAAIFLVVAEGDGEEALAKVLDMLGGLDDLVKTVSFRDLSARFSCIAALGSELWDRLGAPTKPCELKPSSRSKELRIGLRRRRATSFYTSAPSGRTSASSPSVSCSRRLAMR